MGVLNAYCLTLADWAKRLDPDGKTADIVELLSQTNEILLDMMFIEGNLPTGHRTTVRTGLPTVAWRLLNKGVQPTKSTTAQIDESIGIMEAWSEVDVELAKLNGNTAEFRFSEAQAFIEAMNQEMASTLFYGNSSVDPEEFTGLAARYSSTSAGNGGNIVNGGGSDASNQSSMWLIVWGANTIHGVFPKGSKAGLDHQDHGEVTAQTSTTAPGGTRLRVFQDQFIWKVGVALRDWRYVVRIANIDMSNLIAQSSAANLTKLMIKAIHRIPNLGAGKAAFYMNRTCAEFLDIQRLDVMAGNGTGIQNLGGSISYSEIDGKWVPSFRGIPIRICDALLETESQIS
jgi:hypothetical protein